MPIDWDAILTGVTVQVIIWLLGWLGKLARNAGMKLWKKRQKKKPKPCTRRSYSRRKRK